MEIMKNIRNNKEHRSSIYTRYVRLVLWLFRQGDTSYIRLMNRIQTLLKTNGSTFTVSYLKECVRLCNHAVAGQPTFCPQEGGGPRVASRRGFPLIIPGSLRLRMEAMDAVTIKIVLTILSVFRIMKCEGVLKTSTITDPFKGLTEELTP